ncbi:glycosyltransferase [Fervidicoccus fontis]|uniref:Glycosyltransferase, GT2 family n=2 Tax=Fervidicoccus fontis TaxID=683846 RepID=I0A0R8_FERFK|nr:glycosyltransferase [Fervidicoccus fontis]AFH42575.1 glycosyltransferase, GT2 family [Fervidicoccus fontis Kam940]MBE9391183.1 glycosyltransferase [Fervidicoccus fontis]
MKEVSVIFPAKDEEKFIAHSVKTAKKAKNVREIILVDGGSVDNTPAIAKKLGAKVIFQSILKYPGKGVAMRDGYYYSTKDIIVFLDADIKNLTPDFINKLIEPILKGETDFVKGTFGRKSGRVTELVAKPLLRIFYPELSYLSQPLSGEIAGTSEAFSKVNWELGWGVDIGIVLDIYKAGFKIKEENLGFKDHDMKPLPMLTEMAYEVAQTIIRRATQDGKISESKGEELLAKYIEESKTQKYEEGEEM